jgi:hypothetical protein
MCPGHSITTKKKKVKNMISTIMGDFLNNYTPTACEALGSPQLQSSKEEKYKESFALAPSGFGNFISCMNTDIWKSIAKLRIETILNNV